MGQASARIVAFVTTLVVYGTTQAAAHGGPPINTHSRETAKMAAELGLELDADEAPKPEHITKPAYPRGAFDACVEGTVVVIIGINDKGAVRASRVVESVAGLDEAALACVKNWRFKPAKKGGLVVGTVAVAPVVFRIYDDATARAVCKSKGTRAPLP